MIYLLFPLITYAGISIMDNAPKYEFNKPVKHKNKTTKPKRSVRKTNTDMLLKSIQESDKELSKYLKNDSRRLIVKKSENLIPPLSRLKGILLNSVLATNTRATKLLIKLKPNDYFDEAEVRCLGTTFGKRVLSKCNLIVDEYKSFKCNAELWDIDGAEGLISDEYYNGAEKEFLTSSFASFFEGVLDGARDRIVTPFGQATKNNTKNQVMSGLMNIAGNANQKIKNSNEKNLQIALIKSGKEVILFFNEELKLKR